MYTIIELQTNNGETAMTPAQFKATRDEAMSVYHGILAYACISEVQKHTVVVLDEEGKYVARECYKHAGGEE